MTQEAVLNFGFGNIFNLTSTKLSHSLVSDLKGTYRRTFYSLSACTICSWGGLFIENQTIGTKDMGPLHKHLYDFNRFEMVSCLF